MKEISSTSVNEQMASPLERARMRLANAFIAHREAKTPDLPHVAFVIKGTPIRLENLSVVSLCDALINEFEILAYQEYGREEGLAMIIESYSAYVKRSGSINHSGYELISEVLRAAITKAMKPTAKQESTSDYDLEIIQS